MTKTMRALALTTLLSGASGAALAGTVTTENAYLDMGFEELLDVEVTSGTRRAQSVEQSAASVFVIGQDDIRRSPARNVPELLRMVPGLQVQRLDHNNYRVSIRGGSQLYANKLLVMIDGRSIYSPIFGGVFWDQHDLLLEDVERIEVVRGPGGTVWGANATNGVINIITKGAADTEGLYLNAEYGDEDEPAVGLRVGGALATGGAVRVSALYMEKPDISPNPIEVLNGLTINGSNGYETAKVDFRLDQPLGEKTMFTLSSAVQKAEFGPAFARGSGFVQAHVLARVERETQTGGLIAQVYADHSDREAYGISAIANVFDVDLSHHFTAGKRHHLVWGGGFRFQDTQITRVNFDPNETDWRASFFAQDEIAFAGDALKVTLGSKFEVNDITGFEYQPSVRALWQVANGQTVWGALSRNVRTPSRSDRSVQFEPEPDVVTGQFFTVLGGDEPLSTDDELDAEIAYTAELGYRSRITERLSVEGSVFGTLYENLIVETADPRFQPPFTPLVINPLANAGEGRSLGVEIAANANPIDALTLQLAYSYIDFDVDTDEAVTPIARLRSAKDVQFSEIGTSQHLVSLRTSVNLPADLMASSWVRYTSAPIDTDVGDAFDLDLRLTWAPGPVRVSVIGENLLNDEDDFEAEEFIETLTETSPVDRRVTAKLELDL